MLDTHKIISFESTREGAGKTTQAAEFTQWLRDIGKRAHLVKFPYGNFRRILLENKDLDPKAQMLIYHADFAHTLETLIKPLLEQDYWIVLDRYIDSSYAYQAYGHQLPIGEVQRSLEFAIGNYIPRWTFLLDLPEHLSVERRIARGEEPRLAETYGNEFTNRVVVGYKTMAAMSPHRIWDIDASGSKQEVLDQIITMAKAIEVDFRDK